jgi:hypothetical protein
MNVRIVTGYVRLDGPRPHDEYVRLGNKLLACNVPITFFCDRPEQFDVGSNVETRQASRRFWLAEMIARNTPEGVVPRLPKTNNPAKDTLPFHIVQHQKTQWLAEAGVDHPTEMLVWVDLGIFHVPGVTAEGVLSLVERAAKLPARKVTLASIWGPPHTCVGFTEDGVSWFCAGGVAAVLGVDACLWHGRVAVQAEWLYGETHQVSFEVNTWAAAWAAHRTAFHFYRCDHNQTILEAA